MKKMTFRKLFGGLCCAAMVAFAASCAQGADDESWSAGVTNTQLKAPTIDDSCFEVVSTSSGDVIQLTWPVVYGAGGYHVTVYEEANPETALVDEDVDGQTITFPMVEDTNFNISVTTLGNDRLNNKPSEAGAYTFSTFGTLQQIPDGSEIASWIETNYAAPEKEIFGLVYELVAGGQYTLDAPADFRLDKVMLRSDASNPATVTVNGDGALMLQAGLKVMNIKFDCTAQTARGLLLMHSTPDNSISTESLGYKAAGANQNCFVVVKPVIFDNCWVKNLPNAFLDDNQQKYALADFRITNSIIQLKNSGSNGFIKFDKGGYLIQKMTITGSTIYNSVQNGGGVYFIRFSNSSNAQPKKVFGNNNNFLEHTIKDCTIARTFPKKDFANNMPNTQNGQRLWCHIENVLFFDICRLEKYIQSQWYMTTPNNVLFCSANASYNSNDAVKKDKLGNTYTINEDPGFSETDFVELDLNAPNGGLNLKAKSGALAPTIGDPRWL